MTTYCIWARITDENRHLLETKSASQESFPAASSLGITRFDGEEWLALWCKVGDLGYEWPHSKPFMEMIPEILVDKDAISYFMGFDVTDSYDFDATKKWVTEHTEYWDEKPENPEKPEIPS